MRRFLLGISFVILLILSARLVRSQARAKTVPSVSRDDLLRVGKATADRLQHEPARWVSTVTLPDGKTKYTAAWQSSPDVWRVELSALNGDKPSPIATVIMKAGLWYVTEGDRHEKCLAYGFPFKNPTTTALIWTTLPRMTNQMAAETVVDSVDGDLATINRPLADPVARAKVRATVDQWDQMIRQDPQYVATRTGPMGKSQIDHMRRLLAKGNVSKVDARYGLLVDSETWNGRITVADFQWLGARNVEGLDTTAGTWDDRIDAMLKADPNDLALLDVSGEWVPGALTFDPVTDCDVVDVTTGELWRVPFQGVASTGLSVLPGGPSVIASGRDFDNGGSRPWLLNLKTGKGGTFLGAELVSGQIDSGLVSPDAKVLALVRRRGDDPPDQACVTFHTLKPEATTDAGPAGRISSLGWLPDSSGVVVAVTDGVGTKARSVLTRINLDGTRTALCAGNHPSVLPDRKRILFAVGEGDEQKWMTCDFDGKDLSQFGNGFTGYQSAAVPRRGGRVMFLKPGGKSGALLTPVVVDSDGSGEREVPVESHAWTHASW